MKGFGPALQAGVRGIALATLRRSFLSSLSTMDANPVSVHVKSMTKKPVRIQVDKCKRLLCDCIQYRAHTSGSFQQITDATSHLFRAPHVVHIRDSIAHFAIVVQAFSWLVSNFFLHNFLKPLLIGEGFMRLYYCTGKQHPIFTQNDILKCPPPHSVRVTWNPTIKTFSIQATHH